ncbi:YeeE/YedE thiosulfate transporter family protein [Gudongella sp. DL1XJH-153]|uniref:YeeE/YedE thiosulfate transporter family protein n=1 Tax=Gudongella sp. DL1XJH-153 TaxID=3409804 RepID=UPI003BB4DF0B
MAKKNNRTLMQGLIIGIFFGFLLQKGGVTKYDVIVGQLRLIDFTVLKIILTAIVVSMLGISYFYPKDMVPVKTKAGSIKNATIGGLLFGVGFGLLGYCPGTIAGAIGNGYIDAITGGLIGIVLGTVIYAIMYGKLKEKGVLTQDKYSEYSLFHKIKGNPFKVTLPFGAFLVIVMYLMESIGL